MKKQLLKGLITFIAMMFSISYLNAQCPGNKVRMYKPLGRTSCTSRCVSPNQVERYANNGWSINCPNYGYYWFAKTTGKTNNKILSKAK